MNRNLQLRAHHAPWNRAVELLLHQEGSVGTVTMVPIAHPDIAVAPTCSITPEAAQPLMDDLWNCGIRPTEGAGSAGAMRATERHLEDMRKLVFDRRTGA
jgi:hypothetical protein